MVSSKFSDLIQGERISAMVQVYKYKHNCEGKNNRLNFKYNISLVIISRVLNQNFQSNFSYIYFPVAEKWLKYKMANSQAWYLH